MRHVRRWGLTAARRALAARQRQSRQAMPAAPGTPRDSPPDPGQGGESAGDGRAGIMPPPGRPGRGSRAIIRCRARYRIPPGPRPRASAGTRCAHQRRMRDGARPGQQCIWPASPGGGSCRRHSRPRLRARRQATMTSMRPPRTRARTAENSPPCPPATASARRPGHRARGHAAHRPGERHGLAAGPAAPRAQAPDLAGPLRRRCPRLPPVSRLTGPERQVVPRVTAGPAGLPSHADQRAWHSRTLWQALARRGN
jgi:hypothetical protein